MPGMGQALIARAGVAWWGGVVVSGAAGAGRRAPAQCAAPRAGDGAAPQGRHRALEGGATLPSQPCVCVLWIVLQW